MGRRPPLPPPPPRATSRRSPATRSPGCLWMVRPRCSTPRWRRTTATSSTSSAGRWVGGAGGSAAQAVAPCKACRKLPTLPVFSSTPVTNPPASLPPLTTAQYGLSASKQVRGKAERALAALQAAAPGSGALSLERDVLPKLELLESLSPRLGWKVFCRYPEAFASPDAVEAWGLLAALLFAADIPAEQVHRGWPCCVAGWRGRSVSPPRPLPTLHSVRSSPPSPSLVPPRATPHHRSPRCSCATRASSSTPSSAPTTCAASSPGCKATCGWLGETSSRSSTPAPACCRRAGTIVRRGESSISSMGPA